MDAVKGFFLYPVVNTFQYIRFIAGCLIVSIPCCLRLATRGPKSLTKFIDQWQFFSKFPLGKYVISGLGVFYAPYSGTIGAVVEDLRQSECTITIEDYPWMRNPFQSIHAIALSNLGEFATGLSMLSALQTRRDLKGIPRVITCEYFKKARGQITARGKASIEVCQF